MNYNNDGITYFLGFVVLLYVRQRIKCLSNIDVMKISKQQELDRNHKLEEKFALKDGLTFYYFTRSPCARRVWLTILSKNIKCNMVLVDLMKGEQRHPSYLKINPQGKVPAIVVRNHENKNIADCVLYESQAIVEWLEDTFPTNPLMSSSSIAETSFGDAFNYSRIHIKMWQYWELVLAEEIWPLSRQQVDGVIWRINFSRQSFYKIGPPSQQSDDPFYKEKVTQIYEGTYLSQSQCKRSIKKILEGFQMLENELKTVAINSNTQEPFLINATLSQADIAVYPRLTKMPQNGIVCTDRERRLFPHVIDYFNRLKQIEIFKHFSLDDDKIWQSGSYPKFVPQWWGSYLPWWAVVLIGKIRSGCFNFYRVTQNSIGAGDVKGLLDDVNRKGLSVIPIIRKDDIITLVGKRKSQSLSNSPTKGSPSRGIKDNECYLFFHPTLPMGAAVRMCSRLIGFKCQEIEIDTIHLQNYQDSYLRIMPFGEVPSLVIGDKGIYGPHIIAELMHTVMGSSSSKPQTRGRGIHIHLKGMDSLSPIERAIVRRWFGWVRTTWHYQLQYFYYNASMKKIKKEKSQKEYYDAIESFCASSPGKEAVEEIKEMFENPKSYKELEPYACELMQRLQFLNAELTNDFICGIDPTYADIFLLTTIITIERLVVPLDPINHANINNWKKILTSDPIINGLCDTIVFN